MTLLEAGVFSQGYVVNDLYYCHIPFITNDV